MESVNTLSGLMGINPWLLALILVWSLVWKGLALWRSAELGHKYWFVAILLVNAFGFLEIIYLFFVARDYKIEREKKE